MKGKNDAWNTYLNQCIVNGWLLRAKLVQEDNVVRYKIIHEPVHEISNNVVCVTSKASDQPAHTRSLIRAFANRLNIQ